MHGAQSAITSHGTIDRFSSLADPVARNVESVKQLSQVRMTTHGTATVPPFGFQLSSRGGQLMRWIRQRVSTDCGIAAVAIIADVTYEEAKSAFGEFPGRGFATVAKDIRRALRRLGSRLGKRKRDLRGVTTLDLKFDAIVRVKHPSTRNPREKHWIVWDSAERCVLDPLRRRPKSSYTFEHCFRVRGKKDNPRMRGLDRTTLGEQ
jgi:hypothetical protein